MLGRAGGNWLGQRVIQRDGWNKEWLRVTWRVARRQGNWEGVTKRTMIGRTRRESWRNLRMEYGTTAAMKHSCSSLKQRRRQASDGQPIASRTLMFEWSRSDWASRQHGQLTTECAPGPYGIATGTGIPHWSRILKRGPNNADEQALNDGCGSRTSSKAFQAEDLEGKFLLDFGKVGRPRQPICQSYTKMTSLMIPGNFWTTEDKRGFARVACLTFSNYHHNWFWGVETWAPGISPGMLLHDCLEVGSKNQK